MPKNSFYAPREKEANKQKTQALSSFFRKRRGYFPLIIEFAFWKVTWAAPHSVSESGV